jgi:hypothetical protein
MEVFKMPREASLKRDVNWMRGMRFKQDDFAKKRMKPKPPRDRKLFPDSTFKQKREDMRDILLPIGARPDRELFPLRRGPRRKLRGSERRLSRQLIQMQKDVGRPVAMTLKTKRKAFPKRTEMRVTHVTPTDAIGTTKYRADKLAPDTISLYPLPIIPDDYDYKYTGLQDDFTQLSQEDLSGLFSAIKGIGGGLKSMVSKVGKSASLKSMMTDLATTGGQLALQKYLAPKPPAMTFPEGAPTEFTAPQAAPILTMEADKPFFQTVPGYAVMGVGALLALKMLKVF